jgi:hypothetical protein
MIIEITTGLFLIHGVSMLSRLIGRRRDVLYYVSKSESALVKRSLMTPS